MQAHERSRVRAFVLVKIGVAPLAGDDEVEASITINISQCDSTTKQVGCDSGLRGNVVKTMVATLNKESGLKGLSGLSGDTRVLIPAATRGDDRARLAIDVFIHSLQAGIGAMLASLADVPHALVFTDAISEDEPSISAAACAPFAFLGLGIDTQKNDASPLDSDLATETSAIRVLLIKSREACQIARECHALQGQNSDS